MAREKVLPGQRLNLGVILGSGLTGKFVDAIIVNNDTGATVFGPIDFVDRGEGLYTPDPGDDPEYPDSSIPNCLAAIYRVYDDAGKTILSEDDQRGEDFFVRDVVGEQIISQVQNISQKPVSFLVGRVSSKDLTGTLSQDPGLVGEVAEQPALTGQVDHQELDGTVENRQSLEGEVEE